jgi:hypothetical protein
LILTKIVKLTPMLLPGGKSRYLALRETTAGRWAAAEAANNARMQMTSSAGDISSRPAANYSGSRDGDCGREKSDGGEAEPLLLQSAGES